MSSYQQSPSARLIASMIGAGPPSCQLRPRASSSVPWRSEEITPLLCLCVCVRVCAPCEGGGLGPIVGGQYYLLAAAAAE